jgi:hypothetical protein
MQISSDQALDALTQVQDAQRRISVLRGYGYAAPYFFLWGSIWVVGYLLSYLMPSVASQAWVALDVVGGAGCVLIMRRQRAGTLGDAAVRVRQWRIVAILLTAVAFLMLTYAVFQPHDSAQFAVFPALLAAAIYIGVGLWRGARWLTAGLVLGALSTVGYFFLHPYILPWMAVAGGGTLLTTGVWLRRT